jgi:hypothetical protein
MKIEDVQYDLRDDGKYWLRINGYWVMKSTFLCAYAAIHENWDRINWSGKQTAKRMVGSSWGDPAIWGLNQALGRSVSYFAKHDMLPERLELARKSNGQPYKSSNRAYVLAGTQIVPVASVIPARSVKRVGAVDPRTLRISLAS